METPTPGHLSAPGRVVWIEAVRAHDLLRLLPEALFGGAELRFDEHRASLWALRAVKALKAAGLGDRLRPAGLTLAAQDERGRALNYRMESLLAAAAKAGSDQHFANRPSWFRSMAGSFISSQLFFRATFVAMVEKAAASSTASRHDLYLTRHPANAFLEAAFQREGFRLRQSLTLRHHLHRWLAPLKPLVHAAASLVDPRPQRSEGLTGKPAVWVEYYPLDLDSFISRAFWRDSVDRSRYDLAFYFDRSDTPWNRAERARVREAGFAAVECREPGRLAGLSAIEILRLLRAGAARGAGQPLWLRLFELEYETLVACWTAIYKRMNVKLLVQHQEFLWKTQAQARALEAAGGAMMGVHWSFFPYDEEPSHLTPQHVYFVWGEESRRWVESKGHAARHILPCGVWIGPSPERAVDTGRFAPGGSFTLAVFDSSYDYNIYLSGEQMSAFLDRMLSLLERHSDWRAVFKPKNPRGWGLLPRGVAIVARVEALRSARRLLLAERETSPVTAARAADLAACFSVNSAGIVAAAKGSRAIHWDCSGWLDHPFYAAPEQKAFYRSLDELERAVEAAATGDRSVGGFAGLRERVDAFADDSGAIARVGEFVSDYLERAASGVPSMKAVDEAAAAYRARHSFAKSQEARS